MVSANTKQKKMWWNGSQGAHTSAVIKFLSGLTTHTGAIEAQTSSTCERLT
jgi:hypothetical protein